MNPILCSALLTATFCAICNVTPVEGIRCWICSHLGHCPDSYGEVKTCYNPTIGYESPHPSFEMNDRQFCLKVSFPGTQTTPERDCGRALSWNYGLNLADGCQYVTQEQIDDLYQIKAHNPKLVPGMYCTCTTGDECNAGFQVGEVTKMGEIDTPPPGYTAPATKPMTTSTTPLPTTTTVVTTTRIRATVKTVTANIKPVVPTTRRSDKKNVFDLSKNDQDRNMDRNGTDFDENEYDDVYADLRDTDWNNHSTSSSSAGILTAVSCLVLLVCSPAMLLLS